MRGFTLVELAVVLAIVGLLLGALMAPIASQYLARSTKATESEMAAIKDGLLGFASADGRLPCPDVSGDGREDPVQPLPPAATLDCLGLEGALPWVTLGTTATDTWGRIFRYRVTQEFAHRVATGQVPTPAGRLDLLDAGDITVVTREDDPSTASVDPKSVSVKTWNAVAAVVSLGSNGAGGASFDSPVLPPPSGLDELSNIDGVHAAGTTTGANGSASLQDAAADFITAGIQPGQLVVNTTDGSHSLVTAVAATTLSVAGLIGGTDNDFDNGDRYAVSPFVDRVRTKVRGGCNDDAATTSPLCEFDDHIIWISPTVILGRLVAVGRLP